MAVVGDVACDRFDKRWAVPSKRTGLCVSAHREWVWVSRRRWTPSCYQVLYSPACQVVFLLHTWEKQLYECAVPVVWVMWSCGSCGHVGHVGRIDPCTMSAVWVRHV